MNYSLSCFHFIYIMSVSRSMQCTFTSSCVNAAADHKYFTYFTNDHIVERRDIYGHNAYNKPFDLRPWTWGIFSRYENAMFGELHRHTYLPFRSMLCPVNILHFFISVYFMKFCEHYERSRGTCRSWTSKIFLVLFMILCHI